MSESDPAPSPDPRDQRIADLEAELAERPAAPAQRSAMDRAMRLMPWFALSHLFVGVPAFLISIGVAYFTFVQAEATQKMQLAGVWPYAVYETSNRDEAGKDVTTFALSNSGVGPAILRGIEIRYEGKAYRSFRELMDACCTDDPAALKVGLATIRGQVVRPGDKVMFARVDRAVVPAPFWDRLSRERQRFEVSLCYCSVFDDCYVARWNRDDPEPVKQCPVNWVQYEGFPQPAPNPR